MELQVYRNVSVIDKFNIDERTLFIQRFLGENYIYAETTVRKTLNITIGDYVKYNGIKYFINILPDVTKNATNQYFYKIIFESEYYDFAKVQYRLDGQGDFYLMGNLELFLDLLVTNMNRDLGGWSYVSPTTQTNQEYKLLKFEVQNCRQVIQTLCTEFNGEFSFDRKIISFSDEMIHDTGLTFQYKTGLRNITRKSIESGNIITRLYAFGSTKNLGSAYGKLRLELNTGGVDYIESNTATYGIIEGSVIFNDIYPRRTGTVSSVASEVLFTDDAIDFNINDYLINGVTAKVNFLTGNCAGYTFDITSFTWNNPGGIFEIIPVNLEDGSEIPNNILKPAATDTYVIVDITMPASYIKNAEDELLALAQDYLAKYDNPRVTYQLIPDWRYMKSQNVNLTIGDTITIADTDLGVNVQVRITELTQQILFPSKYTLSLTDQVEYSASGQTQIIYDAYKKADEDSKKIAADTAISDIAKSRRNWRDSEELRNLVFDPDGYYFSESIKPLSIETIMLAAGSKSGNFELNGVVISPNYANDVNKLSISAGTLTHMAIDSSGDDNIGTWTLVANTTYEAGGLTTGTAYYLYAKCNKTNYTDGANQVIVSSTAYKADQTTYWYFLIGILHSTTGVVPRGVSLSYGQTLINGGHITTGTIDASVVNVTNLTASNIISGTLISQSIVLAIAGGMGDVEIRAGIATGDFANAGAANGFIIGLDDSDSDKPKFYFGDANHYLKWDGVALSQNGANISNPVITDIDSGSEIAIQSWQSTMIFSATDYRTIEWTAGVITLLDGTTYNILAGNTGPFTQLIYIYLDIASSTTVLQATYTAAWAVGTGKILIAVGKNNTDTTSKASFQVFGGSGGNNIFVDNIAANSASTNEFVSNTAQIKDAIITNLKVSDLSADKINAGTLTGRVVQTDTGGADHYKRAVVDASDNSFKFYNAANIKMVEINTLENAYMIVGDQTGKNVSLIKDGVIMLEHDTAGTVVLHADYWTGDAMDYTVTLTNVGDLNLINGAYSTGGKITCRNVNAFGVFKVANVQVVGSRVIDARCDDALNSGDATTDGVIDALRDAMIAHGLIAAS